MHRFFVVWLLAALTAGATGADAVMGLYEGFWTAADGTKGRISAQVRPLGGGQHDGFVAFYRVKTLEGAMTLQAANGKFTGAPAKSSDGSLTVDISGSAQIENGKLTGSFKGDLGEGTFEGSKVQPSSPTMGAVPPKNGRIIFDGKSTSAWKDFKWKITPEGAAVATGTDIHAQDQFANFLLHVEFRTPLMAEARGQARGNSGVYLQSKYEVQVLDSFGLYPLQNNDCSGIYSLKAPELNACFPPGEWQTYDITYVQGNPARKESPTITVVHNGVTVIEKFEIPASALENGTTAADKEGGFLKLQYHNDAVEYRNIWVEPFFAADRK